MDLQGLRTVVTSRQRSSFCQRWESYRRRAFCRELFAEQEEKKKAVTVLPVYGTFRPSRERRNHGAIRSRSEM